MSLLIGALLIATAQLPTAHATRPESKQLYNQAQRAFGDGRIPVGLDLLGRAVAIDPGNTDVLALRAFWSAQSLDLIAQQDSLNRLGAIDPGRRAGVQNAINAINAASLTPPNPFPSLQGNRTAIVVLGYGLLPDGSMRPELVNRLQTALVQAFTAPFSPVVVTGGNPHRGVTEARAMTDWLIGHGIPASRIHPEHRAGSTVENALYSAEIIRSAGADSAVLITSADHLRRCTVDFTIAGISVVAGMVPLNRVLTQLLPLTPDRQRSLYRDATMVFGLPTRL